MVKTRPLGSLSGHGSSWFISDQEAALTIPCAERQVALWTWHGSSWEGRGPWLVHGPWTTSRSKPCPILEKKRQLCVDPGPGLAREAAVVLGAQPPGESEVGWG